ncbi:MAG: histidine phosphatase family protein [Nocardioidaceae bacterium]
MDEGHRHTGRKDIALTDHGSSRRATRAGPWAGAGLPWCCPARSSERSGRPSCRVARDIDTEPGLLEWDYGTYEGHRTTDLERERGMEPWIGRRRGRGDRRGGRAARRTVISRVRPARAG